jgi:hypothetical protein
MGWQSKKVMKLIKYGIVSVQTNIIILTLFTGGLKKEKYPVLPKINYVPYFFLMCK